MVLSFVHINHLRFIGGSFLDVFPFVPSYGIILIQKIAYLILTHGFMVNMACMHVIINITLLTGLPDASRMI